MRPRTLRSPWLLRRETPRKRCPGGREDARGAVCYTSQLCIGAWNCGGLSNVTMTMSKDLGFDILALSETHKWRSDTEAIFSEQPEDGDPYSGCCICLSKPGRSPKSYYKVSDEARDRRWSWLGHVLRMPEHRLVRQVLLNCGKHTHETLFADVPKYRKRC